MTQPNDSLIVQAEMLIRRPVNEVFEAFIDPAVTTKFWFTRSNGKLEAGKRVRWDWEMYGVSDEVHVLEIDVPTRIRVQFSDDTQAEWRFAPRAADETFVTILNSGFKGTQDEITQQAIDGMGGYTMVLCGLKALLEHNVMLNLVADKAPDAHVKL
ncbi:Uncharacterized conserved protein YndB, AHSA1/START domain [Paenibacillus sp. UNCCL117]|uniref:SRPBCC family protein n=1 Tax=unclassified Paenibacillus TaxID=185978 RepID=UPI0008927607|nr:MULTISPECIES: SRPBCC family protein [unclassified Paenibacillus]SDD79875.1 Uncharacterized conserved protein YndB, AHSA1/START domain [Paenibacillus sp. cl123]SFW53302.1 Uncharacterized conserved protein YndB, AHSA1/START domain [Paenibacillus sp. UNCCL117]